MSSVVLFLHFPVYRNAPAESNHHKDDNPVVRNTFAETIENSPVGFGRGMQ